MKILSQSNYNQKSSPSFSAVALVQIPKTSQAFKNIPCYEVVDLFASEVEKITKSATDIPKNYFIPWKSDDTPRAYSFWEQPYYGDIVENMGGLGIWDLASLNKRMGLSVKNPIREGFHSFFVFTKEHKDKVLESFSFRNRIKKSKIMMKEYKNEGSPVFSNSESSIWKSAKLNDIQTKINQGIIDEIGEPVQKFEIQDLSQLEDVFKKIDY